MEIPQGLEVLDLTEWENRHENFKVSLKQGASFNMRLPFPFGEHEKNYYATTKNFQWLIRHAIENDFSLRAMGNGWSFTDVAVCEGGIVDTRELRTFFKVGNSFLSQEFLQNNSADNLIFTQCGMSILQLCRELESENGWDQCLRACGASNGQTIAGASSTGTHGSAFRVGAVHDSIVGLHLVTGPDRHVWIEKASNPVASDEFIAWLGAERICDDDMFNAAVVSFGSFGFIHGILLETEPRFLLEKFTTDMLPYNDELRKVINTLDFAGIEKHFPAGKTEKELYHFEIIINPHRFAENDPAKGVYVKWIFKTPYRTDYQKPLTGTGSFEYGDDLLGVIQTMLDHLGPGLQQLLVPKLVSSLLPQMYVPGETSTGTMGEMFGNTKIRGKAASAAIGIDCKDAARAIDEIVAVNKMKPFAGALALRFVKGTTALLGFTHFPVTCVLEMDGVDSDLSREFFDEIWNRFELLNIPYTLHWGKINFNLNPERIINMYGEDKVTTWKNCRNKLMDKASRKVFSNLFMERCGLNFIEDNIVVA